MDDLADDEAPDGRDEETPVTSRPVACEVPQVVEQEVLSEDDQEVWNENEFSVWQFDFVLDQTDVQDETL